MTIKEMGTRMKTRAETAKAIPPRGLVPRDRSRFEYSITTVFYYICSGNIFGIERCGIEEQNKCMEFDMKEWPKRLRNIVPRVKRIYYKGNIDLLSKPGPKLAVVGSRMVTDYGKSVIESWVPSLVDRGVTIVSGFMYGVDQIAHQSCLDSGGKTIAVLGWGIDKRVAKLDENLYQKILDRDGLIVSEYPGQTGAERWTFPQRNRIVVGISDAVWVVEGAINSGSMITARLGKEQEIPVLALPGRVEDDVAGGVNNLIKKGEAVMVTGVEDLLDVLETDAVQIEMGFDGTA